MGVYIFQAVDANDDGSIDLGEMKGALKAVAEFTGNKLKAGWEGKVEGAFKAIDADGNKKISGKEAMAAIKTHGIPDINDLFEKKSANLKINSLLFLDKRVPDPEEVWSHFDTDHSDTWNLAEAKAAFKGAMDYFGHELPKGWEKAVEAEFKKADTSGDGEVSPKEMGVYLFELVDANDDGAWDLDEVYGAVEAVAKFSGNTLKKGWKKCVKGAFDTVDTNDDGAASPKEIMAALKKHGVPDINDLFE